MVKKQTSIREIVEKQIKKVEKLLTEKYGTKYSENFKDLNIFLDPIIKICTNALEIDTNAILSDYTMKQLFLIADELEDLKNNC